MIDIRIDRNNLDMAHSITLEGNYYDIIAEMIQVVARIADDLAEIHPELGLPRQAYIDMFADGAKYITKELLNERTN